MPKRTARRTRTKAQTPKLRPEQLLQQAAIAEIEALLHDDITVGSLSDAVGRSRRVPARSRLRVNVGGSGSPYVVDLKGKGRGVLPAVAEAAPGASWFRRRGDTARLGRLFVRHRAAAAPAAERFSTSVQPVWSEAAARRAAAIRQAARTIGDPFGRFEPYTQELTVIWLVRIVWMLAVLPFMLTGRLLRAGWRYGRGGERVRQGEVTVRVSFRVFWIAGGVVTHALTAVLGEVLSESWNGSIRVLRHGGMRILRPLRWSLRPAQPVQRVLRSQPQSLSQSQPATAPAQHRHLPWAVLRRRLAAFIVIAAVVITPLKLAGYLETAGAVRGLVLGESETAVGYVQAALANGQALSFTDAAADFGSAAHAFADARAGLSDYAAAITLADSIPLRQAKAPKAVERLLRSGEAASRGASHLSLAIDALGLVTDDAAASAGATPAPLTERIGAFRIEAQAAQTALTEVVNEIQALDPTVVAHLPSAEAATVAEQVSRMQRNAETLADGLAEVLAAAEFFQRFLGDEHDTRYLLVFQNNAEMRASGGFIGSFALADFRQGALKQLEVPAGGSYDLQGGLHTRVSAPAPLHLINSLWEFQDANWWPDWPTSARKLEWFFVNGWGSSVDGVIAVTPTLIEDILRVIGPVDMQADYGVTVDADNFYTVAQDRENLADESKPKALIRDLANRIIEELPERLTWDKLVVLAGVLNENLAEKQLLLSFDDTQLQAFVDDRNWSGRMQATDSDYLMVVNSNIAGGKSDRAIRQHIAHRAEVTPDGSIAVTLTITRRHTAVKREQFTGVRNVDYIRVYVPEGSQLLSAHGFNVPDAIYFDEPAPGARADEELANEAAAVVDEASGVRSYIEAGKTVFGNWSQVDPGETAELVLQYKLPFKIHGVKDETFDWREFVRGYGDLAPYSLTWQKQPGDVHTTYETQLRLPAGREVLWPKPVETEGMFINGWELTGDLATDKYWGAVVEKK